MSCTVPVRQSFPKTLPFQGRLCGSLETEVGLNFCDHSTGRKVRFMQNEDIPVLATKPPAIAIFTLIDLALLSWRHNNKTQNMHNPFLTAW